MNICLITNSFPLSPEDIAFPFVPPFAAELERRGHRVVVLTPHRHGPKAGSGVRVEWFPWLGGDKPLVKMKLASPRDLREILSLLREGERALIDLARREKMDTCLALMALPSGYFAWRAKRRLGLPYAVWSLGADINQWARYPGVGLLVRAVLRGADRLFADGLELAAKVESLAGRRCDFLPTMRLLPPPAQVAVEPGRVNFLFLGRLERVKGVDVLVEAMGRLLAQGKEARLYIVGAGSWEGRLRAQIQRAGLEGRIHLRPPAPPEEVAGYLAACHCLVIPSRSESIPLVLSEALQMGTPLIVTAVGDMGRLVKEYQVGEVVPPEDAAALQRAMGAFSPADSPRYRENMPKLLAHFDLGAAAEKYLAGLTVGKP